MGTWGYGIFTDDVAADVRETYRDLLSGGVTDDEAVKCVLDESSERGARPALVWLALAASQSQVGRLSANIRDRAVQIIDDGSELADWAPEGQRLRQAALLRLRAALTGPQPARRTPRRQWKPETDLEPGDVLAVEVPEGSTRLLRTVLVERSRAGGWPMIELLDYRDSLVPGLEEISCLSAAYRKSPLGHRAGARRWAVTQHHRADHDWKRAGFTLVGRIPPREGDTSAGLNEMTSTWPALRDQLATLEWFQAD